MNGYVVPLHLVKFSVGPMSLIGNGSGVHKSPYRQMMGPLLTKHWQVLGFWFITKVCDQPAPKSTPEGHMWGTWKAATANPSEMK
jgi:hypothetical protein